jgi:hypothetical protein
MYRRAREHIIALEVMKLERRQAAERDRRAHKERLHPTGARRRARPRRGGLGS